MEARDPLTLLGDLLSCGGAYQTEESRAHERGAGRRSTSWPHAAGEAPYPTLEETRTYVYAN